MNNYRNTLVVAPAYGYGNDLPQGVKWMMHTAEINGIDVSLIGRDQPYHGLYDAKVTRLWADTKDLTGYDFVVMCDASDLLWTTGLGELHYRFAEYKSDFVMGAEMTCWPFSARYADHPHNTEKFGSLNSGFFMGTWQAYLDRMARVVAVPEDGIWENGNACHTNDQGTWWKAYMTGTNITVDTGCKLVQNTFGLDGRWVLSHDMVWGKRPFNLTTHSCPCAIHCNGADKWRLRDIYDQVIR